MGSHKGLTLAPILNTIYLKTQYTTIIDRNNLWPLRIHSCHLVKCSTNIIICVPLPCSITGYLSITTGEYSISFILAKVLDFFLFVASFIIRDYSICLCLYKLKR